MSTDKVWLVEFGLQAKGEKLIGTLPRFICHLFKEEPCCSDMCLLFAAICGLLARIHAEFRSVSERQLLLEPRFRQAVVSAVEELHASAPMRNFELYSVEEAVLTVSTKCHGQSYCPLSLERLQFESM